MKKRVISFFLVAAILFFFSVPALAQNSNQEAADYRLPYPGMLPDNPLYKLKVLRDKIILYLTPDPFKKAQLHLQLADKTLLAALKVAEKNNLPLSLDTTFKGEHQITQMVDAIKRGVYSGRAIDKELVNKAHQAYPKHQQLLDGIIGRADLKQQEELMKIKEFSTRNNNELLKLEKELEIENKPQQQD